MTVAIPRWPLALALVNRNTTRAWFTAASLTHGDQLTQLPDCPAQGT